MNNQKKYEEAAKEYANSKLDGTQLHPSDLRECFLAGAYFAEKQLYEKEASEDNEDLRTLPENLDEMMSFLIYIEDRVGTEAFRHVYSCLEEAIRQTERKVKPLLNDTTYKEQQIERLAEIERVEKEAHNFAIDKALSIIMEKNHDYPIHHVCEELEKLKYTVE